METITSIVSPRPFREILGLWAKVFKLDEAFFAAEASRASRGNTLLALFIYAGAAATSGFILKGIGPELFFQRVYYILFTFNSRAPVWLPLLALGSVPLGFYAGIGLVHKSAKFFGGESSFKTLAYLGSLIYVPLGIFSLVANLIPYVGWLVGLGFLIFGIVLAVRAIKAACLLSTGRALRAFFAPPILLLVIPLTIEILDLLYPFVCNMNSVVINNI